MITPSMWSCRHGCSAEPPGPSHRRSQLGSFQRLPQLLQAAGQPLADERDVTVGVVGIVGHPQSSLNMSRFSVGLSGEREMAFQAAVMSWRAQLWAMRVAIFMRLFSQGMLGSKASAEAGSLGR